MKGNTFITLCIACSILAILLLSSQVHAEEYDTFQVEFGDKELTLPYLDGYLNDLYSFDYIKKLVRMQLQGHGTVLHGYLNDNYLPIFNSDIQSTPKEYIIVSYFKDRMKNVTPDLFGRMKKELKDFFVRQEYQSIKYTVDNDTRLSVVYTCKGETYVDGVRYIIDGVRTADYLYMQDRILNIYIVKIMDKPEDYASARKTADIVVQTIYDENPSMVSQ